MESDDEAGKWSKNGWRYRNFRTEFSQHFLESPEFLETFLAHERMDVCKMTWTFPCSVCFAEDCECGEPRDIVDVMCSRNVVAKTWTQCLTLDDGDAVANISFVGKGDVGFVATRVMHKNTPEVGPVEYDAGNVDDHVFECRDSVWKGNIAYGLDDEFRAYLWSAVSGVMTYRVTHDIS